MSGAALAVKFANTASWLSAFIAAYIAQVSYDTFSFCATDPPAVPTLTASDFLALTQVLDPVARLAAQEKIQQWIGSQVWYDLCECATGPQPTPAAPQSPPANLPTLNPPAAVPAQQIAVCSTNTRTQSGISAGAVQMGFSNSWVGLPVTMVRITLKNTIATGSGIVGDFTIVASNTVVATTTTIDSFVAHANAGANYFIDYALPPTAHEMHASFTVSSGTGSGNLSITYDAYCGGPPGSAVAPCCPPDPALYGQINQILELVTLIQRQAVPFGYIAGTVHAGLSGTGVLSISGIIGCKIAVTTVPGPIGSAGTSPPELFDLGWITFGTADGYPSSYRLERNPLLLLPARCSAYTDLAYDLAPGAVVTITELQREH
jgi:hypothetical protein